MFISHLLVTFNIAVSAEFFSKVKLLGSKYISSHSPNIHTIAVIATNFSKTLATVERTEIVL